MFGTYKFDPIINNPFDCIINYYWLTFFIPIYCIYCIYIYNFYTDDNKLTYIKWITKRSGKENCEQQFLFLHTPVLCMASWTGSATVEADQTSQPLMHQKAALGKNLIRQLVLIASLTRQRQTMSDIHDRDKGLWFTQCPRLLLSELSHNFSLSVIRTIQTAAKGSENVAISAASLNSQIPRYLQKF